MSLPKTTCGTAHVRVRVTLEIASTGGGWGGECSIAQAHKQGVDSVEATLRAITKEHPHVRLVEPIKVVEVVTRSERDE